MTDCISFKKIRTESSCTELCVTASNSVICACAKIYVTAQMLEELKEQITAFLNESDLEGYWENDVPGIGGPPCVTLRLLPEKASDHVLIEIYMELNDGGSFMEHHCRFYVPSTRTRLAEFARNLPAFAADQDGAQITLNS